MKVGDLNSDNDFTVSLNRTGNPIIGWFNDSLGDCASKDITEIPEGTVIYPSRKDCLCGEYGWC